MQKQKHTLKGIELLRGLANQGLSLFTLEDARKVATAVELNTPYLVEALSHLRHHGWIESLKRGLYAFTSTSGIAEPPHEFVIAQALVPGSAISYWTAMRYHEMTQQLPNTIFSMVPKGANIPRSSSSQSFRYIQIKKEHFFGTELIWINHKRICITDRERTLLEGLRHPEHCGGFQEVLGAFQATSTSLNILKLIDYALRLEIAVAKRLGWVLEQLNVDSALLQPLRDLKMKGPRKLDAGSKATGTYIKAWQLLDNT